MPFRTVAKLVLVLLLGTVLSYSSGIYMFDGGKIFKNISEKVLEKSLIRRDLLIRQSKKLNPPARNIFAPHVKNTIEVPAFSDEIPVNREAVASRPQEETFEFKPAIRFIGYIDSGQKIIGLIIFEGEAVAVKQGEMLTQEIKIGKISPKEIEIQGPNSKTWKFSLEGGEE